MLPYQILAANYTDPPEKFDLSHSEFQVQSRASESTRIDRLPMTSC